jgi:glycosyltransferase involved in cell wall biosynthesis
MINFSIIIPHKNTPALLQRCLDSIPRREDIQIIVVDDNSDSDKMDFSSFPGLREKGVEVYFTKDGKGAGYARNIGLEHVKGRWLLFADADDFFNNGFLDILDKYCNSDNDIIYFSATSVDSETGEPSTRNKNLVKSITNYNPKNLKSRENLIYRNWAPWSKMFNHSFIKKNNLLFEEVRVGNDALFVIQAGEKSKRIEVNKFPIYCVTYNKNSLTYNRTEEVLFEERFQAKIRINNYLHKINKKKYKILLGTDIILSYNYGWNKFIHTVKIARLNNNKIIFSTFKDLIKISLKIIKLNL